MMKILAFFSIFCAFALSGCTSSPLTETKVVSVVSSKPYRFIKYTNQCDAPTIRRIKTHNYTHALVKRKEKEAEEKAKKDNS